MSRTIRSVLVAWLLLDMGLHGGFPTSATADPVARRAPAAAGELTCIKGSATVTRAGKVTVLAVEKSMEVLAGDTVKTGADSAALIETGDAKHYLGPASEMTLEATVGAGDPAMGVSVVRFVRGFVAFFLPRREGASYRFQAATESVVAAVEGTQFTMEATDGGMRVGVFSGKVSLFAAGTDAFSPAAGTEPLARLEQGDRVVAKDGSLGAKERLSVADIARFRIEIGMQVLLKAKKKADLSNF